MNLWNYFMIDILINILIKCVTAIHSGVPLFLGDYEKMLSYANFEPDPFVKMSTAELKNIIAEIILKSKIVLIYIEESFCLEDISIKDKDGTPFLYLRKEVLSKNVKFFPSVMLPFKTLTKSFPLLDKNKFHLGTTARDQKIYNENMKHYYIFFEDGINETRTDALRRHDLIMRDVYLSMRDYHAGPTTSFYTGRRNSIDLVKQNTVPIIRKDQEMRGVTIKSYGAMFRLAGVYSSMGHRRSMFAQMPVLAGEKMLPQRLSTRMAYLDYEIEFNFNFGKDTWVVDNVVLLELGEEVGRTKIQGEAPWNCSYACGHPLVLVNTRDASSVTISRYQVEPFLYNNMLRNGTVPVDSTMYGTFGPAVNCAPYFSFQILAGLMITFICAAILACGFTTLYNCRSNDRYDDPQGKVLFTDFH